MEDTEGGKNWLLWVILVPVGMAAGVLVTKLVLQPRKTVQAVPAQEQAEAVTPAPAPEKPAAAGSSDYDLPGDEPAGGEAGIIWADKSASASQQGAKPGSAAGSGSGKGAQDPAVDPKEAKKYTGLGLVYGALTKATDKMLNNPKALAALLNNDYVVKGFMSRDTVKNATANSGSLANYLKNPANLNQFMAKSAVQRGINDQQMVSAAANSKLAMSLMDTPGGKALLRDPAAISAILQENPGMASLLSNPAVLNALVNNPKTAGVVTQIQMTNMPR